MRMFVAFTGMIALLLAGCRSSNTLQPAGGLTVPPGIESVNVCHIFNPRTEPFASGTAFPIGLDRLVSCRHNFPPYLDSLWVNGGVVPIAMQRSGGRDDQILEDWCEFEVPTGTANLSQGTSVDFKRTVQPGETIYLIGFYGGPHHGIPREVALQLPKKIVAGTVVKAPLAWREFDNEVIFVDAPEPDAYHGISGGAAVVYDNLKMQWVIVGLYRGAAVEEHHFLWWTWSGKTYHTVLRPPIQ